MATQSRAWSENTGRLVKALCLLILCLIPASAFPDNAGQAGSALGNTVLQRFGSPEGVNQAIAAPFTSSDMPMRTLDGAKSFSAQLLCPSSRKFIEVIIQPTSSGDLSSVIINQDIDMDGNTDNVFSVPFPVSGICANGVISCDAGTWGNCRYFRWEADSSARIGLVATAISNLGGCYCINASCGNNLAQGNMTTVLKDLGGGVAGAVQAVNRKFAVTDVKQEGPVITYYGEDSGQCSRNPGTYGSTSPEQYYNPGSDSGLAGAKDMDRISQSNDPESYYSLITNSQAAQVEQGDFRPCPIIRNILVTTVMHCSSPGDALDTPSNSCAINDLGPYPRTLKTHDGGGSAGCYFPQPGGVSSFGGAIDIGNALCGDPHGGVVKNARIRYRCGGSESIVYSSEYQTATITCPSGDLEWIEGWYYASNVNHIDCPEGYTDALCNGLCCRKPADMSDIVEEVEDNRCRAYESDSLCRLRDEKVDGVYTINNFVSTTLQPFRSCRTFTGHVANEVCRDWWRKDRTYFCKTSNPYNFDDTKKRLDSIQGSVSGSSRTLAYTDLRKNTDGSWSRDSVSTPLGSAMQNSSQGACDLACKTRKIKADTQAGKMGNKSQYQINTASYDFFYRLCRDGICPQGEGEEVVIGCGCLNGFNEATAVLSVLDAAGKDLTCTTGVTY